MARPRLFVLSMLGLLACDSAPASVPKPPPVPPLPALRAPAPAEPTPVEPVAQPEPARDPRGSTRAQKELPDAREAPAARAAKQTSSEAKASAKPTSAKVPAAPREPLPASSPAKPVASSSPAPLPPSQQPQIIASNPKPAAATKVSVPKTVHVAIDVPAGLQADLDHDPRMQPWVNQVVATIDRCHGQSKSNGSLSGTIEVLVTMHENERPDADIKQLPPALSPIVACATGGLMRTKMPLFTGKEGARYTVRIRFSP